MLNFKEFLKENIREAIDIVVVDKSNNSNRKILVKYEKIKVKQDNVFDICINYHPANPISSKFWKNSMDDEYNIIYLRFLLFKIGDYIHFYAFDGSVPHETVAELLSDGTKNYKKLYTNFNDYKIMEKLDLESEDWCLPLVLYEKDKQFEITTTDDIHNLIKDKEIYKYIGVTKDEYNKKMKTYD